ncbi:hypothetical protein ACFQ60_38610 [Streptomyces zhihengii]
MPARAATSAGRCGTRSRAARTIAIAAAQADTVVGCGTRATPNDTSVPRRSSATRPSSCRTGDRPAAVRSRSASGPAGSAEGR